MKIYLDLFCLDITTKRFNFFKNILKIPLTLFNYYFYKKIISDCLTFSQRKLIKKCKLILLKEEKGAGAEFNELKLRTTGSNLNHPLNPSLTFNI